ncbi:MAG TPA: DUF2271 domain-containing protein [Prolixibacteraceae bacterium]|jgi:hypothetical protein
MRTKSIQIKVYIILGILCGLAVTSTYSQTAGTLTFSSGTYAPSSDYGLKHVLAVWLENTANPSVFIKTKAKYGNEDDHLTSWIAKSNYNVTDAVTGATLGSYGTITGSWNGTNVAGTVVPDGTYNLFIEMGWGRDHVAAHAVQSFTFTKGPTAQHLTPAGTTNYMNVVIDWVPLATLIGTTENFENVNVYPNPTSGMININFNKELSGASMVVTNLAGKAVYSQKNVKIPVGSQLIDLSSYQNGVYFINIEAGDLKYNYKVLINK